MDLIASHPDSCPRCANTQFVDGACTICGHRPQLEQSIADPTLPKSPESAPSLGPTIPGRPGQRPEPRTHPSPIPPTPGSTVHPPHRAPRRPFPIKLVIGVVIVVVAWNLIGQAMKGFETARQQAASAQRTESSSKAEYPVVRVRGGRECARSGRGPLAAVGTGNKTTSCEFARNVRRAYLKTDREGTQVLHAYSPKTKKRYRMRCTGTQPVACRGGVAGFVVIYGGKLKVSN